ncbi:MAG: TonB-dependent receptor [Bacteroidetes bacterium]|nr:TonB-dependent receptor [Bacteroidota bacterium]
MITLNKKKLKQAAIILFACLVSVAGFSQEDLTGERYLHGYVYGLEEGKKKEALIGANVYWLGTNLGIATIKKGEFKLKFPKNMVPKLVVSFIGYQSDTIEISSGQRDIEVTLLATINLEEYEVKEKRGSTFYGKTSPIATQIITNKELTKAACCNLSESFETNASVDVSYADAVTGAKQIELLGLSGIYTQMQFENTPEMRGLAGIYGLTFVPGPWLESISISKGTASVRNGFESITGQINYEYKKPDTAEKFYFNLIGNNLGRVEVNSYSAWKLGPRWSTMLLAHANKYSKKIDLNDDSFMDLPISTQFNLFNRWKYRGTKIVTQFGVNYISEQKNGGQIDFNEKLDKGTENSYGIGIDTRRLSAFWKAGLLSFEKPNTSLAMIHSFQHHEQNSYYGLNDFKAKQTSWYSNLMFQSIIGNTSNTYTIGLSIVYDDYDELLKQPKTHNEVLFKRQDIIPGAFFEYTYKPSDKFAVIAGLRDDYHNHFGNLFTPRLHIRYRLTEKLTFRASAGKGYRFPSVLTEQPGLLLSNKEVFFYDEPTYEEAWNYGLFISQDLLLFGRNALLNLDFYRTDFLRQMIVDMDGCVSMMFAYELNGMKNFYNGKSFANSAQAELRLEPIEGFDLLLAYRINDVKTTYSGELREKLMTKRTKALLNISYITSWEKWQFDYTLQQNGKSRLPLQVVYDDVLQEYDTFPQEFSPLFIIMNAQVTRRFKNWEVYAGIENLTNFTQDNPIEYFDEPFSLKFDATRTWGPVLGRKVYLGLKMNLF